MSTEQKALPSWAMTSKKKEGFKSMLAGGLSGAVEISIMMPTEFVKTQVQLYPQHYGKQSLAFCIKDTIKKYGITGFWTGVKPLIVFAVPKNGVRFFTANKVRDLLSDEKGRNKSWHNTVGGFIGGAVEGGTVVAVQETMKVRLIHDSLKEKPRFRGAFHGIYTLWKEEGFKGCYRGVTTTILKQSSNQAIRFFTYFYLKDWLIGDRSAAFNPFTLTGASLSIFSGAVAGAASVFGNTPMDVIKTKMQGMDAGKYKNSWDCAVQTFKQDGWIGFYKGTIPRLMRVGGDVAITMYLYELFVEALDHL